MTTDSHKEAVSALEAQFDELGSRFRRLMAENAQLLSPDLQPGAYKIFTTIVRHGEVTASALCEELVLDKGQLSRLVRDLEEMGLVTRQPDPRDRRSALLSPSESGLARLEAVRARNGSPLSSAVAGWRTEDVITLAGLLSALSQGESPDFPGK